MSINAEGIITHFNKAYGRYLNIDPAAQIGRHITDVVENTRMHIVAKTGKAEINDRQSIKGQNMIVQRIPIKKNGETIAVFGQVIFKDVKEVGKLAKKLDELESKVRIYQKELDSLRVAKYSIDSIVGEKFAYQAGKKRSFKSGRQESVSPDNRGIRNREGAFCTSHSQCQQKGSTSRSSGSTAQPYLASFWSLSCSVMKRVLLPERKRAGKKVSLNWLTRAHFFSMKSAIYRIEMQPKLLRALEEKEFERVGGNRVLRSDFRLIAASNQDLEAKVKEKTFRADLFYRLNVMPVHIPPLRERGNDILLIARHILEKDSGRYEQRGFDFYSLTLKNFCCTITGPETSGN